MRVRDQTENRSSRVRANHTETGSWGAHVGTGVGSTKDRDVPALGARARRVAVGRTTRDNVGFLAARTEAELKWPGELSGELTASVLRQRLGYSHCCSDSQKSHRKPPGKAARGQKPRNTGSHCAHPEPPSQETGRLY